MKNLGIAGAGIGAAAAAAPAFTDMADVISKAQSIHPKNPWYVKEREYLNPTTEIDWNKMERFEGGPYDPVKCLSTADYQKIMAEMGANRKNFILNNAPGKTLRDFALNMSAAAYPNAVIWGPYVKHARVKGYFLGEQGSVFTPQMLGVPRWEGTPEDNARMMRSVFQHFGAAEVSFGEIIEGKTKKLINLSTTDWGPNMRIMFEDVDKAYVVDDGKDLATGKMVIPNRCKSVIVFKIRQSQEMTKKGNSYIARSGSNKAYDQLAITNYRVKAFLNGIGYEAMSGGTFGITCARPGWGALFGMGELARSMQMIAPTEGPVMRATAIMVTDLPLPVTNPIDAGTNKFCHSCFKCADICPSGAIYKEPNPDFIQCPTNHSGGVPGYVAEKLKPETFNNSPGYKRWPLNHFACRSYWTVNSASDNWCIGACVFNKMDEATIHPLIKMTVGASPVFNGFFTNMDIAFGYDHQPEDKWEDWWNEEHKVVPMPFTNY
ncbi:MAG: reductive dehalogenase [Dehalogenimonas sp.]